MVYDECICTFEVCGDKQGKLQHRLIECEVFDNNLMLLP